MTTANPIFEENVKHYARQLAELDFPALVENLGLVAVQDGYTVAFFDEVFRVSTAGIQGPDGNPCDYLVSVILSKYLLLCPPQPRMDPEWASFKDFKRASHFTNFNYFASDTEQAIEGRFGGQLDALAQAGRAMGATPESMPLSYDLALRFHALPRLDMLLLFNDGDADFPAKCTVLFQRQAEWYLDPESLAMCGAQLARRLKRAAAA